MTYRILSFLAFFIKNWALLMETKAKHILLIFLTVVPCCSVCAQTRESPRIIPGAEVEQRQKTRFDAENLFARASSSDIVIEGVLVRRDSLIDKTMAPGVDEQYAGELYDISVRTVLCERSDFEVGRSNKKQPERLRLVIPTKPLAERKPRLAVKDRFLLFLRLANPEQVTQWAQLYGLDANQSYYQIVQGPKGAIKIDPESTGSSSPGPPPVLEKLTKLCEALKPTTLNGKLDELRTLEQSSDPILAREAAAGIDMLQNTSKR